MINVQDTANKEATEAKKNVLPKLKIGHPPFIHSGSSISKIMFFVIALLILPVLGAIYFYGMKALIIILSATISSIIFDLLMKKVRKKKITLDGSETVTGILLALTLPSEIPFYVPVIGSAFAIIIVKHTFGGLGNNIFNPALAARAFIGASWPLFVTAYAAPAQFMSDRWFSLSLNNSLITSATPLASKMLGSIKELSFTDLLDPFIGNISGSIGETSAILLIITGIILLVTKIIDWRITIPYVAVVFIGGFIYAFSLGLNPLLFGLYYIFTGGLLLGAVFMATDYVTSPTTKKGRIIFGIGCGLLTLMFRIFSQMPEGVCFSILLMNILTPLIDKYTFPRPFGWVNEVKAAK